MHALLHWIGTVLILIGVASALWAFSSLGPARFVGRVVSPPALVLRGPYLRVRHPFSLGLLVSLTGVLLTTGGAIAALLIGVGIMSVVVAIRREERRLGARFGEAYRRYRDAVPPLLPLRAFASHEPH